MALTKPKAYQLYDIDYKQAALVVTTNNIVLSGAAPNIIDGVVLAQNSRILVAGQTNQSENGIYYVSILGSGANGTWLRSQDAVTTGQLLSGTIITVTEGTVNRDTQWMVTTDGVITIGTTGITFAKISDKAFSEVDANGVPIVATTFGDTLTLASGNNISIYANANTKTITISSTFAEPTRIINGSSNVTIPTANGNVAINVGTVANVGVFSPSGLNLFGSLSATGNANILGNLVVGGSYTAGNVIAANLTLPHGSYIIGDMIPSLDSTFSLGNSTRQWKDLWLSNSTLYLGQIPIRTNSANQMTVNSNVVLTANANSVVNLSNLTLLDTLTANGVYVSNANRDATVSADIVVATVVDANLLIGNGAFITDIYSNANVANYLPTYTGPIGNGGGTVNAANANIGDIVISSSDISTNASSNTLTLDPSTASGTIGVVFVNGNFSSSNTITGGDIISNSSITASGPISTSNTIVGNGIVSNSTISAIGNVSGGNITTSGDIVATGNLTVGEIYPTGNIIPSANVTYSLGNSTNQWKDLWISNSTIYIDSIPLSVNSNSELTYDGNTVVTADANANGNVNATYFVGDGTYLSNIPYANVTDAYSNANVYSYLGANTTNVNIYSDAIVSNTIVVGDLSVTGNSISTTTGNTITIDPAGVGSTGNVVIEGNLQVNGDITYINSNTLTVNDKFINLANNAANSAVANGGGIGIGPVGSEYATITYNAGANAWQFSSILSGDGGYLSNIIYANLIGAYSNANVADYLPTYTGPIGNGGGTVAAANANIGAITIDSSTISTNTSSNILTLDPSTASGTTGVVFVDGKFNSSNTITGSELVSNSTITASDTITGGNLATGGNVTATGTISSANTITGLTLVSNSTITAGGAIDSASSVTGQSMVSNSTITASNTITGGNLATGGTVVATGAMTSANTITGQSLVSNSTITASDTITGGNLATGGTVTATGTINSGNTITGQSMVSNSTITASNTITGGNLATGGTVVATGAMTSANTITGQSLVSNSTITASDTITGGNLATGGNVTATGTMTSANTITGQSLVSNSTITASDTITGGNLATGGTVVATGTMTSANTITGQSLVSNSTITASDTITGGNLATGGTVVATGAMTSANTITGQSLVSNSTITATGTISSGNTITGQSLVSNSTITATGTINSGNTITGQSMVSNSTITASDTITGGNLATGGTVTATGTISSGNTITGQSLVSNSTITASDTITGGNLATGGTVTATGTISSGNTITGQSLVSNSTITASDTITGGNLATGGNITGGKFYGDGVGLSNIPYANITGAYGDSNVATYLPTYTGNLVSLTGPVTTTNVVTAAQFVGNGIGITNIAGANVSGTVGSATLAVTVTGNTQSNITSVGTLTSLNVTGNVDAGASNIIGNIKTANYFIGNGYFISSIHAANIIDNYSNSNVAAYLPTYTGNLVSLTGPVTTTGYITAGHFIGDGNGISNIAAANIVGAVTSATTAATVTGNTQSNITSIGTLANLTVTSDVTTTSGLFKGDGGGLSNIIAANVVGAYGNANVATLLANTNTAITTSNTISATNFAALGNGLVMSGNSIVSTSNTITLDPGGEGSGNSGTLVVHGNLQVSGNVTFVDATTAVTNDLTWVAANNAINASAADGGGLEVGPAATPYASWLFNSVANAWVSNLPIKATGGANIVGALTGATTGAFSGAVTAASFGGDGGFLSNVNVANVTGAYTNSNVAAYLPTYTGNLVSLTGAVTTTGYITAGHFIGDGNGISNIAAANIVGAVASATTAATVTGNAQSNITSVGTLANLTATGFIKSTSGLFQGDGGGLSNIIAANISGTVTNSVNVTGNNQPNITSVGTLANLTVTGFIESTGGLFKGDGGGLSNINIANIAGSYANSNVAAYLPTYTGNLVSLTGAVTTTDVVTAARFAGNGNTLSNIQVGNVTGLGNIATTDKNGNTSTFLAGDGTWIAVTSYSNTAVGSYLPTYTGNLVSLTGAVTTTDVVTAAQFVGNGIGITNIAGANVSGTVGSATMAATVTTNAQPNITSVGTLANLTVTGFIESTGGLFKGDGGGLSNINIANIAGSYANSNVAAYLPTYTGNLVSLTGPVTTTNVITAAQFVGNGIGITDIAGGNVSGTVGSATLAVTVTSNAQPNITSVGILSNLTIANTGNLIVGNANVLGEVQATYFIGNGSQLTGLPAGYANSNVADYLPTYTGNLVALTGPITTTNVVTAAQFVGAGNTLSNIQVGNVTGLGNIATIDINGNASTFLAGDGSWTAVSSGTSVAAYTRTSFTATAGQTTFTVAYTVGYLEVFLNGILLNAADYTATNGTSVVLASAATAGDILETVAYNSIAIGEIGNITGGNTGSLPYQSAANTTSMLAIGNVGQVLTVANGLPVWANATGGGSGNITISNELANANVRYPLFADTSNGSANTVYAANTKLQFTPSTGQMTAGVIAASEGIILTANTISANYAIPAGYNGLSAGPITVTGGSNITVPPGSRWAVV